MHGIRLFRYILHGQSSGRYYRLVLHCPDHFFSYVIPWLRSSSSIAPIRTSADLSAFFSTWDEKPMSGASGLLVFQIFLVVEVNYKDLYLSPEPRAALAAYSPACLHKDNYFGGSYSVIPPSITPFPP
jgi:hypothetical protein